MDKFIFQIKKAFWVTVFTVLDEQGNEKFRVRTARWPPGRVSVFEGLDNEPCLTVRSKPGLTLNSKYIIQDKSRAVIAEIISKFTFRCPACWKISDVQSGCEIAEFCENWSFLGLKVDILVDGERLGTLCNNAGEWYARYMLDLSGDSGGRVDRRIALAFAAFLCYRDANSGT